MFLLQIMWVKHYIKKVVIQSTGRSLFGFIVFIRTHKNIDELKFIYQTNETDKTVNIGLLPEAAFDINFAQIGSDRVDNYYQLEFVEVNVCLC